MGYRLLDSSLPETFSRPFRLFPAPLTAPGSPRMYFNMQPLMPDEDKNFGGSLVLDFRK